MWEICKSGSVRGIEGPRMVEYCGTLETERQEKQRKQIKPKMRKYNMSTRHLGRRDFLRSAAGIGGIMLK